MTRHRLVSSLARLLLFVALLCSATFGQQPAAAGVAATEKPGKKNIAIMTLKNASGITQPEAELISDRLSVELFNTGKVNVMERNQMQDILKEQGFQQSGTCTDEACLVEMGQLLGVKALVSGSIGKLGSMYLINLRLINVQTAQITHVVSQDIKGGIEEVAGALRDIARQLVMDEPGPVVEVKKQEPRREERKAEVKAEEPPPPVVEPAKEPEPQAVTDKKAERNKNRGGVRLQFSWYPADMTEYARDKSGGTWQEQKDRYDAASYDSLSKLGYATRFGTNLYRWEMLFAIPLGKVLELDVGPGLAYYKEQRYFSNSSSVDWRDWTLRITSPNVTLGFGFVKRFYPLKINVGALLDLNFNILRVNNSWDFGGGDNGTFHGSDFSVNASFGPRVGVELMGGPHFGVNVDFQYRYSRITNNVFESDTYDYRFLMAGVGLNTGVNFYF
jgi:TolB-like protein